MQWLSFCARLVLYRRIWIVKSSWCYSSLIASSLVTLSFIMISPFIRSRHNLLALWDTAIIGETKTLRGMKNGEMGSVNTVVSSWIDSHFSNYRLLSFRAPRPCQRAFVSVPARPSNTRYGKKSSSPRGVEDHCCAGRLSAGNTSCLSFFFSLFFLHHNTSHLNLHFLFSFLYFFFLLYLVAVISFF